MIKLLDDAEKAIATLMLEVNRLNDELELVKKELALQKLSDIGQSIERELTDEEMLEVYKKCLNLKNEFKENVKRRSYFDFARAILKKASNK